MGRFSGQICPYRIKGVKGILPDSILSAEYLWPANAASIVYWQRTSLTPEYHSSAALFKYFFFCSIQNKIPFFPLQYCEK